MRTATIRYIWPLIIAILLSGCSAGWTRIEGTNRVFENGYYRLELPSGWVRIANGDSLLITRDGPAIQRIEVDYHPHEKAFEQLKSDSAADMLPGELAELYIGNFKAQDSNSLPSLEVLRSEPATISGHKGFRLHLKFTAENGLDHESLVSGFANERGFYTIRYTAPSLHFFPQHKAIYLSVVASFKSK